MVVNLGDIVGYGASPNEVIERSRTLGHIFVRGNHDKAASGAMDLRDFNPIAGLAALWTRDQLTPQNLKWLQGLPPAPSRPGNCPPYSSSTAPQWMKMNTSLLCATPLNRCSVPRRR